MEHYYERHDSIVVFGDFNSSVSHPFVDEFMINFALTNLVKVSTCYKNSENPSTIDLILTNRKHSFQNTTALEVGISDFHKLVLTVLKAHFQKAKPKIITYHDYKKINDITFHEKLKEGTKTVTS